jgi:hypothetical protein
MKLVTSLLSLLLLFNLGFSTDRVVLVEESSADN